MRIRQKYLAKLNELIPFILGIESDVLTSAEKIVLLALLFDEGIERQLTLNDRPIYFVARKMRIKDLASKSGLSDKSINNYLESLTRKGFLRRMTSRSQIYAVVSEDFFNYCKDDKNKILDGFSQDDINKYSKPSKIYALENAFPNMFIVQPKDERNLSRILYDLYHSIDKKVFWARDENDLIQKMLGIKQADNIYKLKSNTDVMIVSCFSNVDYVNDLMWDIIYERYKNNLCTVIICKYKVKPQNYIAKYAQHNEKTHQIAQTVWTNSIAISY